MAKIDDFLSLLPENIKNGPRIRRYFEILLSFDEEISLILDQINSYYNLDEARDFAVDLHAETVNLTRSGETDAQVIERVRRKRALLTSKGTTEDINSYARSVLGESYIGFEPLFNTSNGEARVIRVLRSSTDLDVVSEIKTVVAVGVRVEDTNRIYGPITGVQITGDNSFKPTNFEDV